MVYVFLTYNHSLNFDSPESWFKRTEGYAGMLTCLSKKNTVINIKQINYEGECTHNGIHYHFVNFGKKKTYFPWQLNRFVKNLNPDIVFVQGFHNPFQVIQLGLILKKTTKIIVQNHAEQPSKGIRKYLQQTADRFVDAHLFASKAMGMDWVTKGIVASPQKIHEVMEVSSNFYPVKKAAARLKTGAEGTPAFLWVGRLNENKDPLNVVKAFLSFSTTNPSARLYMIYHTDELFGKVKELIANSVVKNTVSLIGQVAHDDLLYWFNSADFFISGSHYEGSGTALCEAMSCGCIPIVTDILSFRAITDDGKCGILYEAGNEAALLSALKQSQQLHVPEMQKRSLEYFKTNLSFEAIARQIHEIAASL